MYDAYSYFVFTMGFTMGNPDLLYHQLGIWNAWRMKVGVIAVCGKYIAYIYRWHAAPSKQHIVRFRKNVSFGDLPREISCCDGL